MDAENVNGPVTYTPNFLRVATELSKFKDPYKAADMLLLFIKDSMKDSAHTE